MKCNVCLIPFQATTQDETWISKYIESQHKLKEAWHISEDALRKQRLRKKRDISQVELDRKNDALRKAKRRKELTCIISGNQDAHECTKQSECNEYKKSQKIRETQQRAEKRKHADYKTAEKDRETLQRRNKRKLTDYKKAEKERETLQRTEKRQHVDYKEAEKERETLQRTEKRQNVDYKAAEKERETLQRTEKRKCADYKAAENKRETLQRADHRKERDYRKKERLREKNNKAIQRQVPAVQTKKELIEKFHNIVSEGPVYSCTSCSQLWFRHSVQPFPRKLENAAVAKVKEILEKCPRTPGVNGLVWICLTCYSHIRAGNIPPLSKMNKMGFPKECILQELNPLEQTLLAVRLPFMRIHQAPRGRQKKLHGNMVLVPADVENTVSHLPRLRSNTGTIKPTLKRWLRYKHHVYSLNIRPELVKSAAKYLATTSLFKQHVTYDSAWDRNVESTTDSDDEDEESPVTESRQGKNTQEQSDKNDEWSEVDEAELMSGQADTMLTAPDYIEPGERDHIYHFAPGEGSIPVSVFMEPQCEELAFPGIFCGEERPSDRPVKVSYGDIVKTELRNADGRASRNIENLFFKTRKLQMKTLLDQGQLALRKVKVQDVNLTVKDIKGDAAQSLIHQDKAYKFLARIRGSPAYFEKVSKDLFAIIRQLGPATFFITLSVAESRWKHLLRILGSVVDKKEYTDQEVEDMTWDDKCRLIQSDPITCARHFDYSVAKFLSVFLQSKCQPLSKVEDYFSRVEYQQRGSPHVHMMVWCKDAPKFGQNSNEEVCELVEKFISCASQPEGPELTHLVELQVHRHSHTCRLKREKMCRFGFPKPPLKKTTILYPLDPDMSRKKKEDYRKSFKHIQNILNDHENDTLMTYEEFLSSMNMTEENYINAIRSSLRTPTLMLARHVCDSRVNNYNEDILLAWRANIDIQFIIDVYACATYVAAYVTKSQRGISELLRQATEEVRAGNLNLKEQIRTVGNRFLNAVEISAQEAAYICLQLPMKQSSRQVVFINTGPPSERVTLLKSQAILETMEEDDDDIECSNDISRYATRPSTMEHICLAEFVSSYERISTTSKPVQNKNKDFLPESSVTRNDDEETDEIRENENTSSDGNQSYRKRKKTISFVLFTSILTPIQKNSTVNSWCSIILGGMNLTYWKDVPPSMTDMKLWRKRSLKRGKSMNLLLSLLTRPFKLFRTWKISVRHGTTLLQQPNIKMLMIFRNVLHQLMLELKTMILHRIWEYKSLEWRKTCIPIMRCPMKNIDNTCSDWTTSSLTLYTTLSTT